MLDDNIQPYDDTDFSCPLFYRHFSSLSTSVHTTLCLGLIVSSLAVVADCASYHTVTKKTVVPICCCCCCSYVVGRTTRRHPASSSRIFFTLHLYSPRSCHPVAVLRFSFFFGGGAGVATLSSGRGAHN